MADLDLQNAEPGYLCGRLLATLDVIQSRALGNPNATIVDKFYGTASSAPASVFGTLLHGAQAHMSKLHRDQRGTYIALNEQLETIMEPLTSFPVTLDLKQQGLFALGFYHQRAANRRAARERIEQREHLAAADLDGDVVDRDDVTVALGGADDAQDRRAVRCLDGGGGAPLGPAHPVSAPS